MSTSPLLAPIPRARVLLGQLTAAIRAARFYPPDHPLVERLDAELLGTVRTYHAEGIDVQLTFHGGEVILGDTVLTEESMLFDQLARELSALGANSIAFRNGTSAPEIARFVTLVAAGADTLAEQGGLATAVSHAGMPHIDIAAVTAWATDSRHEDAESAPHQTPREAYEGATQVVRELHQAIREDAPVEAGAVRTAVFSLLDNVISNRQTMVELAGLKTADETEFDHAVNVAILSLALGAEMSDDPRFLDGLGVGALLHDVGTYEADGGPDVAGAALDMRDHPAIGAERTARLPGLDRAAIVVIYEHHQGADNSGFPAPAEGHRQSLAARIVAVTDAFDRLTRSADDRRAMLPDEAMAVLTARAGADLDVDVVRLFVRQMSVFPRHSVVQLTSGESAVVLDTGDDPVRPVVRVFTTVTGAPLAQPHRVDLAEDPDGPTVAASADASECGIDIEEYL